MCAKMTFGDLFAGIGGISLGLERAGMVCKWQVEIDPFCQKVLAKHWPSVPRYGDIREIDFGQVEPVDLICGGPPCQPHSLAGQRRGAADDRNLWPEMCRAIEQLRPTWVIFENVPGIVTTILDDVLFDLEGAGYAAGTLIIPACGVGAPHRRDRVWVVAYTDRPRLERLYHQRYGECVQLSESIRQEWEAEPRVDRVALGIPHWMERLRSLGNAVVPQVAEWLGRQIIKASQVCGVD